MVTSRTLVLISLLSVITALGNEQFVTPFGSELGVYDGVVAYSNGNDENISTELNYVGKVFTGLKWQCVEYARRWLVVNKTLTFAGVDGAEDIWFLNSFINVKDGSKFHMIKTENGATKPPGKNSIIIWKRSGPNPFGHVAVITEVSSQAGYIRVAEQNVLNDYWPGLYARELKLNYIGGKWYIENEDPMYGWIDIGNSIH